MRKLIHFFVLLVLLNSLNLEAQDNLNIKWISFDQLEDSLKTNPKRVFIDFHADWCAPCLKMDQQTFKNPEVVALLNTFFHAVKMNVETKDTIVFGGKTYINEKINKPNPVHQIPLLLARRKNKPFNLPAMVFYDDKFKPKARYFQYLGSDDMIHILKNLIMER